MVNFNLFKNCCNERSSRTNSNQFQNNCGTLTKQDNQRQISKTARIVKVAANRKKSRDNFQPKKI